MAQPHPEIRADVIVLGAGIVGVSAALHLQMRGRDVVRPRTEAVLNHPVVDVDGGLLLAPMTRGIRLTTGVEFAARDAAPMPLQLDRTEPLAREVFPLGQRIDPHPWMGARPCLPDMRPIIGAVPRHKGL